MINRDHLRIDMLGAQYLEALEQNDFDELARLWGLAIDEPALLKTFDAISKDLLEEQAEQERQQMAASVAAAVEATMPSAPIVRDQSGPLTVTDVVAELKRMSPRLSAEGHACNERLAGSTLPLPDQLDLSDLVAWAESSIGPAPPEYWAEFRKAAIKLRMRQSAEVEFQMAARKTAKRPSPGDR